MEVSEPFVKMRRLWRKHLFHHWPNVLRSLAPPATNKIAVEKTKSKWALSSTSCSSCCPCFYCSSCFALALLCSSCFALALAVSFSPSRLTSRTFGLARTLLPLPFLFHSSASYLSCSSSLALSLFLLLFLSLSSLALTLPLHLQSTLPLLLDKLSRKLQTKCFSLTLAMLRNKQERSVPGCSSQTPFPSDLFHELLVPIQ